MSTKTKTLAKSLHTITALVGIARHVLNTETTIRDLDVNDYMHLEPVTPAGAIAQALEILGYTGAADPYDLAGKALKALETEDEDQSQPARI